MKNIPSAIRNLSLAAVSLALAPTLHAAALISFDFAGYNNTGPAPSSSNVTGATPSALDIPAGSGLAHDDTYPNDFGVAPDAAATTLALAEANNDYISFTVTPATGYTLNLTDLSFVAASFNHDTSVTLTDSSENALGSATVFNGSYNSYQQNLTLSIAGGEAVSSPMSFRLYDYGTVGSAAPEILLFNNGGNVSFSIDGTASAAAAPEPTTLALGLAGAVVLGVVVRRRRNAVL